MISLPAVVHSARLGGACKTVESFVPVTSRRLRNPKLEPDWRAVAEFAFQTVKLKHFCQGNAEVCDCNLWRRGCFLRSNTESMPAFPIGQYVSSAHKVGLNGAIGGLACALSKARLPLCLSNKFAIRGSPTCSQSATYSLHLSQSRRPSSLSLPIDAAPSPDQTRDW
jgi:hypothetical protein